MSRRPQPMFLARETYRLRRLMDAARFLPFLGFVVFVAPALWSEEAGTAAGVAYIFAAWAVLIGLAFVIARRLRMIDPEAAEVDEAED